MAYVAVGFQGLMGELLFWKRRWYAVSCFLLAIIGLLESGLQRLLVVTIIYGDDIWKAINDFLNKLTKQKEATNYSFIIGGSYVALHLLVGIVLGSWLAGLPKRIEKWSSVSGMKVSIIPSNAGMPVRSQTKKRRWKIGLFITWIALLALYIQSEYKIGTPLLPSHVSIRLLLRSLIIVLAWVFIVGPLLRIVLHRWLQKKKSGSQYEVQQVVELLPSTMGLLSACWKQSTGRKGIKRIYRFCQMVLVNAMQAGQAQVHIVLGPIQSGKTTTLLNWSLRRNDVRGILTPVEDGKRMFVNVATKEKFAMESDEGETEVLKVGRFIFSKEGFEKAVAVIREAKQLPGWLIIDEIGPMELRGEGFHDVLKEVLATSVEGRKIILVIRQGLEEKVISHFEITGSVKWSVNTIKN
jgi:nucleoside-triphosphatase THEP1